jgi:dynein heavy chain
MIFEVMDLAQASPATVSRCGMVYIDPDEIGWLPYAKSWVQRLDESVVNAELKMLLVSLFEHAVEKGFAYIKKHGEYSMHQVRFQVLAVGTWCNRCLRSTLVKWPCCVQLSKVT